MPTYHLEIDLDNAAFWGEDDVFNGWELGRILAQEANEAGDCTSLGVGESTALRDSQGNRVGCAWITE